MPMAALLVLAVRREFGGLVLGSPSSPDREPDFRSAVLAWPPELF